METKKWNICSFEEAFVKGTRGRKTQHGNRYVVEFDNCDILMGKDEDREEKIIAINLGKNVVIANSRSFGRRSSSDITRLSKVKMDFSKIKENLAYSGLIDYDENLNLGSAHSQHLTHPGYLGSALFKIGSSIYLHDYHSFNAWTTAEYIEKKELNRPISFLTKIPRNNLSISSIQDARAAILPKKVKENFLSSIQFGGRWLIEHNNLDFSENEKLSSFKPPEFPNPKDFNIEEPLITFFYLSRNPYQSTIPTKFSEKRCGIVKYNSIKEYEEHVSKWKKQRESSIDFLDKLKEKVSIVNLTPQVYQNLDSDIAFRDGSTFVKGAYFLENEDTPILQMENWHEIL